MSSTIPPAPVSREQSAEALEMTNKSNDLSLHPSVSGLSASTSSPSSSPKKKPKQPSPFANFEASDSTVKMKKSESGRGNLSRNNSDRMMMMAMANMMEGSERGVASASGSMRLTKEVNAVRSASPARMLQQTQSTLAAVRGTHSSMAYKAPAVTVSDLELENIRRIFKQFDADGSNTIDVDELSQVMTSLGVQMDQEQLRQLVEQVTDEGEQELTFDEFVSLITLWKEAAQYKLFEGDGFKSLAKQHVEAALTSESLIPDSPFRAFWDSLVCIVAVTYWIFVLLFDAYSVNNVGYVEGLIVGDVVCTLFLIGDVVVCSRTAFSRDGKTIDDVDDVFENYKKSWMAFDILAALPLDLILSFAGASVAATALRHLRLLKLLKLPVLWKTSDVVPITSRYITFHFHLLPMFQLAVTFILMVHGFAIGWVLLKQRDCSDPLIVNVSSTSSSGCVYPYTPAIYFVIYTLSTVGLGDVRVSGESEYWYVCAVLVGAMASNGIVIGKLVQILQRADIKKEQRSKIRETLAVLEHYHIATQLQTEILQFQAHVFENNLGAAYESIVSDLPAEMRTNISLFVRMKLVSVVPIFHQSHFMLRIAVAQALTNAVARPEQYMCVAGQKIEGLYFLAYGFADTFDQKGAYKQTLRSGDFFGDESLIGNGLLDESVKALTYCDLWILDAVTFESLLERFPKFRRTVELLRSIDEERHKLALQKATSNIVESIVGAKENFTGEKSSGTTSELVINDEIAAKLQQKQPQHSIVADQNTPPATTGLEEFRFGSGRSIGDGVDDEGGRGKIGKTEAGLWSDVTKSNHVNLDAPTASPNSTLTEHRPLPFALPPPVTTPRGIIRNNDHSGNSNVKGQSERQQQSQDLTTEHLAVGGDQQHEGGGRARRRSVVTFRSQDSVVVRNDDDKHRKQQQQQSQPAEAASAVTVRDLERFLRQVRKFKAILEDEKKINRRS